MPFYFSAKRGEKVLIFAAYLVTDNQSSNDILSILVMPQAKHYLYFLPYPALIAVKKQQP